jgi:hypothetical protein
MGDVIDASAHPACSRLPGGGGVWHAGAMFVAARHVAALVVGLALVGAPGAPPAEGPPPRDEPVWQTILLAPGRVIGHGRFDAADPGSQYRAERAAASAPQPAPTDPACPR